MMADLLQIRAKNGSGHGLTWEFVDEGLRGAAVMIDQPPMMTIHEGEVWHAELVSSETKQRRKIAIVRLIARVHQVKPWHQITSLPDFHIDADDLRSILIWLNEGTNIVLIGPKGTGKTTLPFMIAKALGWQEPCKVDVYTIKRTTDLFGSDAAHEGSTHFRRSELLDYIERAQIALRNGLDSHFIVILDEMNRVHAKSTEAMHGLFDDTRQVTVTTTEGSKIVKLPPNMHFIGTMNMGSQHVGTYELDDALKDRFAAVRLRPMPEDYEVKQLVADTSILEAQATAIVQIARALRDIETAGQLTHSPSYRGCKKAGQLVKNGMSLKLAILRAFLAWPDGKWNASGEPADEKSELGRAFAALRMKGIAKGGAAKQSTVF
jgi:MoxR-like ATPase